MGNPVSSSCIGCPTATDHTGAVMVGVAVAGMGVAAWGFLGSRGGGAGRLVAAFVVVCGLALVVIGV